MNESMDTRLPPGTIVDSHAWYDVLAAVFDPLNTRAARAVWGLSEDEYAAMTRGQQAVFDLRWLRECMEADTILEYGEEPMLREHADRLVEDAELVGAHPFVPILAEIAPLVAEPHAPPLGDELLSEVHRFEEVFFSIEDSVGALWDFLADYVRGTPEQFIVPAT